MESHGCLYFIKQDLDARATRSGKLRPNGIFSLLRFIGFLHYPLHMVFAEAEAEDS